MPPSHSAASGVESTFDYWFLLDQRLVGWNSMANPGDAGDGWHGSKLQGVVGTRDSGAGGFAGRGRRAGLRAISPTDCAKRIPRRPKLFEDMREEESRHRAALIEISQRALWRAYPADPAAGRQGIRRSGEPFWLTRPLKIAGSAQASRDHGAGDAPVLPERAMTQVTDAGTRKLLGDLRGESSASIRWQRKRWRTEITPDVEKSEEEAHGGRLFVLQIVQPGLAGLMDGSRFDAGPGLRGGVCDQRAVATRSCGTGGVDRRRHFDGVRRGAVG